MSEGLDYFRAISGGNRVERRERWAASYATKLGLRGGAFV